MIEPNYFLRRRALLLAMAASGTAGGMTLLTGCAAVEPEPVMTEELAYQWGLEAYIYNFPLAYFARIRALRMLQPDPATRQKSQWSRWAHRNAPVTPEVAGAPQTDTLYSSLWLDVAREPVVVNIPPVGDRYWSVQFSDLMGTTYGLLTRRNFHTGGPVLVTGPGWSGTVPAGMQHLPTAMAQSFNLLRLFFSGPQDLPAAIAMQEGFQAVPLSLWQQGQRSFAGIDGSNVYRPVLAKDDTLADFKAMQQMWKETPLEGVSPALRRRFARLGLLDNPTGFDGLAPGVRKALERAEAEGRRQVTQASLSLPDTLTRTGWVAPRPTIGYYNDGDRMYRASVTLAGTVAVPASENPYYILQKEPGTSALLHGDRRYQIRFEKGDIPEVDAFWSIHAYNQTYRVIPNAISRYSIGDRSSGLQRDADGSLTLYVQAEEPEAGKRANWLPVKKGEAFWLIIRAYEPRGKLRDMTWEGPRVSVQLSN